ncbi:MAG: hypothetical protein KJ060_19070, partial [Candidatus Hydrogenedentes bacterium]|nr:hypothetical protein [Candidatus Hydrogenedentota bacterium]
PRKTQPSAVPLATRSGVFPTASARCHAGTAIAHFFAGRSRRYRLWRTNGRTLADPEEKELSMSKTLMEPICMQQSTGGTASVDPGAEINPNNARTEDLLKKGMDVVDESMSGKSREFVQSRRYSGGE